MQRPGVIVTDGNERAALAVTRSLGRRGIPVFVGAETAASLAGLSRYCRKSFVYPSPWIQPEEYVACVLERAKQWGAGVVFPMTDLAVELLGEYQQQFGSSVILPIPSLVQYRALSNKYQLMASAKQQGIPIPHTIFVPDGNIETALPQIVRWPIVIKPGRSLIKIHGRWNKTSVLYARDAEELRVLYQEIEHLKEPSLLQARVIGEGQGVFGLFNHGKPVTLFAHRRLRERPPSGGISVLRESMALQQPITDYALRVIHSTGWHGVAMVEFKVDAESAIPYLMEVNGRLWGSLQLAIDAGVDFPWLLYQLGTDGAVHDHIGPYQVGVRSRWWLGDLDHLLLRLRKSDNELNLPPGSPSKLETVASFLQVWDRRTRSEVFRLADMRPGIYELATYGVPLIQRVGGALKARVFHCRVFVRRALWDIALVIGIHRMIIRAAFPRKVTRVLVLCKGNICRSPFAAELLRLLFRRRSTHLEIVSAGLDTTPGKEAYPLAKRMSGHYGINLDRHRTDSVTAESVATADVILVMEVTHVRDLVARFPAARSKTFLLGHFSSSPHTEIQDPYGGTPDQFTQCYGLISAACEGFVAQVVETHSQTRQYEAVEPQ